MSSSSETLEVNENIQANGRYGVVQTERNANITVNADLYAVYTKGRRAPEPQWRSAPRATARLPLNGGDYRQVGVPENDPCDLIYGDGSAQIFIKGGTFKAAQPERTLNCKDGSGAKITVSGGSFYKYDPFSPHPRRQRGRCGCGLSCRAGRRLVQRRCRLTQNHNG